MLPRGSVPSSGHDEARRPNADGMWSTASLAALLLGLELARQLAVIAPALGPGLMLAPPMRPVLRSQLSMSYIYCSRTRAGYAQAIFSTSRCRSALVPRT